MSHHSEILKVIKQTRSGKEGMDIMLNTSNQCFKTKMLLITGYDRRLKERGSITVTRGNVLSVEIVLTSRRKTRIQLISIAK